MLHILDTFLIHYLHRFDKYCFTVTLHDKTYTIGEGEPLFHVKIHKDIPKKELLSSTSLALGEAYMRKDLEIEGDLFTALQCILSQTSQFSLDKSALGRILYTSESKATQKKQVSSHYDLGNDFYSLWLDPSMSYSCAYFKEDTDTLEQAQHHGAVRGQLQQRSRHPVGLQAPEHRQAGGHACTGNHDQRVVGRPARPHHDIRHSHHRL